VAAPARDAGGIAAVSARAVDAAAAPASLRPMRESDLDAVMAIELRAYPFPWTRGIFRDCLLADYPARVLVQDGGIIGYGMLSVAADEAHVLNVCAAPDVQGRGHGRRLLRALLQLARGRGVRRVFLEVRPSNTTAIALYHAEGFNEIGRRPRYYPAKQGREDAIVMAMELFADG
jgi:ribosomal-protein-alanine N-acetyltransferase